jgi:hypothetical protein
MMAMLVLLRCCCVRATGIAASHGTGRIHRASLGNVWPWPASVATVISETTFTNGMLKTLSHITQSCFTKMLHSLTDMRVAIRCGCGVLMMPLHIRSCLGTRTTIWAAIRVTTRCIWSSIRTGRRRCRRILGTVLIRSRLLRVCYQRQSQRSSDGEEAIGFHIPSKTNTLNNGCKVPE